MKDLDIQVGDRVTFKDGSIKIIVSRNTFNVLFTNTNELIEKQNLTKIERIGQNGWYTVYEKEEKKELLTKKEKDFLKKFIEFYNYYIIYIIRVEHTIIFYTDCHYYREEKIELKNNFFNKLENNRKYTLSELELED